MIRGRRRAITAIATATVWRRLVTHRRDRLRNPSLIRDDCAVRCESRTSALVGSLTRSGLRSSLRVLCLLLRAAVHPQKPECGGGESCGKPRIHFAPAFAGAVEVVAAEVFLVAAELVGDAEVGALILPSAFWIA